MHTFSKQVATETSLSTHPQFGDWNTIVNRIVTFYSRGLEHLSPHLDGAKRLIETIQSSPDEHRFRFLMDPVIRDTVNEGLAALKQDQVPSEEVDRLLQAAAKQLAQADDRSPVERGSHEERRAGTTFHRIPVWTEDRHHDVFSKRFRAMFDRELANAISSRRADLINPTAAQFHRIQGGVALLHDLIPELAKASLPHIQLICLVDMADERHRIGTKRPDLAQNVSTHAVPGTIFLSPTPLRDDWHAAEAIFHEGLHKKLSDLTLTHSIFKPGYDTSKASTIKALWNRSLPWNSNKWPIDRALFAFHVYLHLGVFFSAISAAKPELFSKYGDPSDFRVGQRARGAYDRARYLGHQLTSVSEPQLGEDGKALVNWLRSELEILDPQPPREDPSLHLLLDRFDRTTHEVVTLLNSIPSGWKDDGSYDPEADYADWDASRIADHLIHSDLVAAYRILSVLGEAEPPRFSFYDGNRWSAKAPSTLAFSGQAATLEAVRTFISSTLRAAPEDALDFTCKTRRDKTLWDLVEDMVEHVDRHLETLCERLSDAVE